MAPFGRAQKASALLPLAVLSAAWTAGLATAGSNASAAAGAQGLSGGTQVPSRAVRAPASLSPTGAIGHQLEQHAHQVVATASQSGIPAVALAAYQRAATVIDAADQTCHLPWQLVAAIGRVESDHGRAEDNVLTDHGIDKPGIYGPVLDGRHGTVSIKDTDAGQYDHDARFDRAVGPMQFIPSTWAIVGVDADNDGRRDPQDIYDASLGAAVYLCSGPDDLATAAGQRASVFRYNHSRRYVDLVLAIEHAYLAGDFSEVPNYTTANGFSLADPPTSGTPAHHRHHHDHHHHHGPGGPTATPSSGPTGGPTSGPTHGPTHHPSASASSSSTPGIPPVTIPGGGPTVTVPPDPVPTLLTTAQAIVQCLAEGLIEGTDAFNSCVYKLTHG